MMLVRMTRAALQQDVPTHRSTAMTATPVPPMLAALPVVARIQVFPAAAPLIPIVTTTARALRMRALAIHVLSL